MNVEVLGITNVVSAISEWMVYGGILAGVILALFALVASRYVKVGPNEALIISGMVSGNLGFKVKKGGGAFVWPFIQQVQRMSLETMTLDLRLPEVYTVTGVPIVVSGVAQIKVDGSREESIGAAAEFLVPALQSVFVSLPL